MSYELVYSEEAATRLQAFPDDLLRLTESHLLRLAERPTALSRPSRFPYPPNFQLSSFSRDNPDGSREHATILFHYGQDEQRLLICAVGYHKTI